MHTSPYLGRNARPCCPVDGGPSIRSSRSKTHARPAIPLRSGSVRSPTRLRASARPDAGVSLLGPPPDYANIDANPFNQVQDSFSVGAVERDRWRKGGLVHYAHPDPTHLRVPSAQAIMALFRRKMVDAVGQDAREQGCAAARRVCTPSAFLFPSSTSNPIRLPPPAHHPGLGTLASSSSRAGLTPSLAAHGRRRSPRAPSLSRCSRRGCRPLSRSAALFVLCG